MCRDWVDQLRRWDREGVLDFLPIQDPMVPKRFHWIPTTAFAESVHVVAPDGSTWHGAGAAERLAHLLPGGWPLALLFRAPLVRGIADGIYRRVARTRASSMCEVRPPPEASGPGPAST